MIFVYKDNKDAKIFYNLLFCLPVTIFLFDTIKKIVVIHKLPDILIEKNGSLLKLYSNEEIEIGNIKNIYGMNDFFSSKKPGDGFVSITMNDSKNYSISYLQNAVSVSKRLNELKDEYNNEENKI